MQLYALVDIGCLECGASSDLIGVFDSKEKAEAFAAHLNEYYGFIGAQHSYEVFSVSPTNEINPSYLEKLKPLIESPTP